MYCKEDVCVISLWFQVIGDPLGWGFVVRGAAPCYVQAVDPGSPAAAAGVKVRKKEIKISQRSSKFIRLKISKGSCNFYPDAFIYFLFFLLLWIFFPGAAICVSGEWKNSSLPGLQVSHQTGDDWTSSCCSGSYGTTGLKATDLYKQRMLF